MEEVKNCRRKPVLIILFFLFFSGFSLLAQRPSQRNQQAIIAGRIEPGAKAFVISCLGTSKLAKPLAFYYQGDWFVQPDTHQSGDDNGTALVWLQNGHPRAISQWIHDDEFDRHTLACLDEAGIVTHLVNTYMPGLSEPELHWCYIHTFIRSSAQHIRAGSHYTDWNGNPIPPPRLTSEDRDFIAGERQYKTLNDFDFAAALQSQHQP